MRWQMKSPKFLFEKNDKNHIEAKVNLADPLNQDEIPETSPKNSFSFCEASTREKTNSPVKIIQKFNNFYQTNIYQTKNQPNSFNFEKTPNSFHFEKKRRIFKQFKRNQQHQHKRLRFYSTKFFWLHSKFRFSQFFKRSNESFQVNNL